MRKPKTYGPWLCGDPEGLTGGIRQQIGHTQAIDGRCHYCDKSPVLVKREPIPTETPPDHFPDTGNMVQPTPTTMKYIVTTQEDGTEEIFIFSKDINHACMAESINHMRNQNHSGWRRISRTPLSAGFIEGGKCVGMSESLHLNSRPQDTALLAALGFRRLPLF